MFKAVVYLLEDMAYYSYALWWKRLEQEVCFKSTVKREEVVVDESSDDDSEDPMSVRW